MAVTGFPSVHTHHAPCLQLTELPRTLSIKCRMLRKHGAEIARMAAPEHLELIPLVEVALAVMRLSCERFFVLASVLAAYLLFGARVPRRARAVIRLNHRVSTAFQRVRCARASSSRSRHLPAHSL